MENKTPFDIIQLTENATFILNKLSEDFLSVESHFNSVVGNLNKEKIRIENKATNTLTFSKNQYKQQILERETDWNNGTFIPNVLKLQIESLNEKKNMIEVVKWATVLIGVLILFFIKWYIGILIGGIGFFVFYDLVDSVENKIRNINSYLDGRNNFSEDAKIVLKAISSKLKEAINSESNRIKSNIEILKNSLESEYNDKESIENEDRKQKLNFHEQKSQNIMSELQFKTGNDIKNIKTTLCNLVGLLNQFPETFDSNNLNWKEESILKGKDAVLPYMRIGKTKIIIGKKNLNVQNIHEEEIIEEERSGDEALIDNEVNYLLEKPNIEFRANENERGDIWSKEDELQLEKSLKIIKGAENRKKEAENRIAIINEEIINLKYQDQILPETEIDVPFIVPFLNQSNIVFNCNNIKETKEAIRISHNIIGRTLLSLPASKTKITFIDPLELGGNAAPFTPLLREIYGGMVFTQQNDIENQLSILTRAIENVIQKYLQDKFTDIADYNFKTKEVPEPYRLLIVYNFPHSFNDITASKLLNIIKSGPKAGVHTILVNDKNAKLPYGLDWKVFEGINIIDVSLVIPIKENKQFEFDKNLPYTEIVDYVNKELPNTNSIKVPFTKYIAPQSEWWKEKAHKSFEVPIGRHALEVQNLKFDNDDDNQALLIGKPGSGKSNLLHVIIANSLWKYSPDQLEIYLIDFKGGVEFTVYADKKIPHIKTIAIESEREFGLSVLDGVERELLRREIEFSKTGVQNLEQYHNKFPNERMPRVMLIVDEFQEFYAEDDNIKQAVDDKFDRIVRKGRAFGINTLFSSQTLSGNSIKKSTKELIDIRLALMCSDLDSNQILDDRNPAARDLTRPGEGIYNSENGKVEGNRRFQAFFIDKENLIKTIESVVAFANTNGNGNKSFKQIIFRGSEKARLQRPEGHPIESVKSSTSPKSLRLWVGEPVAIAEDVTAILRKQGGSNLLVAGYDESIGLRVMSSSAISIAAQQQPNTCKFYFFNFYNVDSEFVNVPGELFSNIDQESVSVNSRQVKQTLQAIKEEIEGRLTENSTNSSNIYLTFFSFQRGRAFRKDGYSMSDEGNLLAYILKEGADVGVYSLVQVDTMDNFSKSLDDNLLKEFSQRIASQMNPDNSVKVIGNQKAAKLGSNRAWYYDDNENTMIKFKPYELPTFSWIKEIKNPQPSLS